MSTRRPYSLKEARQFCARLAEGESLTAICSDPNMPRKADILDWLCARADFRVRYARARELQSHILLEEILAIADGKGEGENVQDAKQRIDTRKWVVDRLAPKTSGEKAAVSKPSKNRRPVVIRVITGVPRAKKPGSSDEGDRSRLRAPPGVPGLPRAD